MAVFSATLNQTAFLFLFIVAGYALAKTVRPEYHRHSQQPGQGHPGSLWYGAGVPLACLRDYPCYFGNFPIHLKKGTVVRPFLFRYVRMLRR